MRNTDLIIVIIATIVFVYVYAGDVLSALSRNAMVMNQKQQQFSQTNTRNSFISLGNSSPQSGLSSPKSPLSLVPVPYRNSKLTHLLKGKSAPHSQSYVILYDAIFV